MVIKKAEEDLKCSVASMKTEYLTAVEKEGEQERQYNKLVFRVVFTRGT